MTWHFLPVSRDRYETAQSEVLRLQRRCEWLEKQLVQVGIGALQSSLRKNGYAQIGEPDPDVREMIEPPPVWSQLDHNLFETWRRDYMNYSGGTENEARHEWEEKYGDNLPTRVLI